MHYAEYVCLVYLFLKSVKSLSHSTENNEIIILLTLMYNKMKTVPKIEYYKQPNFESIVFSIRTTRVHEPNILHTNYIFVLSKEMAAPTSFALKFYLISIIYITS